MVHIILALSRLTVDRQSTDESGVMDSLSSSSSLSSSAVAAAEVVAAAAAAGLLVRTELLEVPSPPREPRDPEAIRKYCGRTSASGRESSSLSYAPSTVKKAIHFTLE